MIDLLPIVFPVVFVFSMSTACCLRRQITNKYSALEARIVGLEQKIASLPTHSPQVASPQVISSSSPQVAVASPHIPTNPQSVMVLPQVPNLPASPPQGTMRPFIPTAYMAYPQTYQPPQPTAPYGIAPTKYSL